VLQRLSLLRAEDRSRSAHGADLDMARVRPARHRTRSGGVGLVFPSTAGTALNRANVHKASVDAAAETGAGSLSR
jgi:hypothetical protein